MQINVRADCVEITGYVNAVERNSKPLASRLGRFVERIRKGAFTRALSHADDVLLLENHDKNAVLGSTKQGNLELTEDSIGLRARAIITDPDAMEKARRGDYVGWSFGFYDTPNGVESGVDEETKLPLRKLRDLDLREVSILDRNRTPAYDGTLLMARDDDCQYYGEPFMDEVQMRETKVVDLTPYWDMVDEMYHNLIQKRFNPNHGKDGRFTTGSGGSGSSGGGGSAKASPNKGGRKFTESELNYLSYHEPDNWGNRNPDRDYLDTNTDDALKEIKDGKKNSLYMYMDAEGKLTPDREAVHENIIDKELEGKVPEEGQATMTMLGGGPASGKSSVMSTKKEDLDEHTVVVDPDAMKKALPNYAEMAKYDDNTASYYHEESSALAKRLAGVSFNENYDVIYDGTGDGSRNSVMKKINQARENGYRVEGKYVTNDIERAVELNRQRYENAIAKGEPARLVPEQYVRDTHRDVTDILVATASKYDYTELWDNNGAKGEQKLIATGGGGFGLKPVAGQEQAFMSFLSKGSLGTAGFEFLPDGTVQPTDALLANMDANHK